MQSVHEQRPLGELVTELTRETSVLIRKEVQLATAEIAQKATIAGRQAKLVGLGGALANTGLIVIAAALVMGLGTILPFPIAALLIGIVLLAGGYVLAHTAMKNIADIHPAPQQTLKALKENKLWLREQLR